MLLRGIIELRYFEREEDRSKVLEQAGLKLRREAPGIPVKNRRRAPDAPGKKRRAAPSLPASRKGGGASSRVEKGDDAGKGDGEHDEEREGEKLDTLDAYARYENYLARSQARLNQPRPTPTPARPISPQTLSSPSNTTRPARSTSIISQPSSTGGGSGRFSGLISRIMAPSTSEPSQPRKSISIVRVESDQGGDSGEKEKGGGTWTSLVDPSVLGTMSDMERKRQEVSLPRGPKVQAVSHLLTFLPFPALNLTMSPCPCLM